MSDEVHESIREIAKGAGVPIKYVVKFMAAFYRTTEHSIAVVGTSMVESSIELIRQKKNLDKWKR